MGTVSVPGVALGSGGGDQGVRGPRSLFGGPGDGTMGRSRIILFPIGWFWFPGRERPNQAPVMQLPPESLLARLPRSTGRYAHLYPLAPGRTTTVAVLDELGAAVDGRRISACLGCCTRQSEQGDECIRLVISYSPGRWKASDWRTWLRATASSTYPVRQNWHLRGNFPNLRGCTEFLDRRRISVQRRLRGPRNNPRAFLLVPNTLLTAILLRTYPTQTVDGGQDSKNSAPPSPQVFEGTAVWQANLQGIHNLMGFVCVSVVSPE